MRQSLRPPGRSSLQVAPLAFGGNEASSGVPLQVHPLDGASAG